MADGGSAENTKLINIGEFKEKWLSLLTMEDVCGVDGVDSQAYISLNTSVPSQILSELETVCSPDTLDCPEVPKDTAVLLSTIPSQLGLQSVIYQEQELKRRSKSDKHRKYVNKRKWYTHRRTPWVHHELSSRTKLSGKAEGKKAQAEKAKGEGKKSDSPDMKTEDQKVELIDGPEVLLTVEIYKPFQKHRRMMLEQEMQLLSSQCLTELRDRIRCLADHSVPGEHSDQPNLVSTLMAKDYYKSGYFFIRDIFYNDMRDPNNQDNSQVVSHWAKRERVGEYSSCNMENVRFTDLTVQLGHPYLYEHQGQCQHLIVFSDVRLVHKEDCQDRNQYPVVTVTKTVPKVICRVCNLYHAKWMTRNSPISPEDPCFFCNSCFQAFHYDVKGAKLFEFKAYHFNSDMK